ncbi:MAG: hypothetical protein ACFCVH_15845 [Alphaproteobacteria bacterium]
MPTMYGRGFGIAALAALAFGSLAGCQADATGRIAAGQAALAAGYPFGTSHQCDGEVARQLQENGISAGAVDNIWYQDQEVRVAGRDDRLIGYLAYARLVDQSGLLVVDLTAQCITRQVYTRDGLELPGISAF